MTHTHPGLVKNRKFPLLGLWAYPPCPALGAPALCTCSCPLASQARSMTNASDGGLWEGMQLRRVLSTGLPLPNVSSAARIHASMHLRHTRQHASHIVGKEKSPSASPEAPPAACWSRHIQTLTAGATMFWEERTGPGHDSWPLCPSAGSPASCGQHQALGRARAGLLHRLVRACLGRFSGVRRTYQRTHIACGITNKPFHW